VAPPGVGSWSVLFPAGGEVSGHDQIDRRRSPRIQYHDSMSGDEWPYWRRHHRIRWDAERGQPL